MRSTTDQPQLVRPQALTLTPAVDPELLRKHASGEAEPSPRISRSACAEECLLRIWIWYLDRQDNRTSIVQCAAQQRTRRRQQPVSAQLHHTPPVAHALHLHSTPARPSASPAPTATALLHRRAPPDARTTSTFTSTSTTTPTPTPTPTRHGLRREHKPQCRAPSGPRTAQGAAPRVAPQAAARAGGGNGHRDQAGRLRGCPRPVCL